MKDKPQILVVDDHRENLIAIQHVLKKVDGEIICVESGNSALKEF